jgi:hypothetical protein
LLIEELTDAPVEEMTERTPEELAGARPETPPAADAGAQTADLTGELSELAEEGGPAADAPGPGAAPVLPVQRTSGPTGEFPRPGFPGAPDGGAPAVDPAPGPEPED